MLLQAAKQHVQLHVCALSVCVICLTGCGLCITRVCSFPFQERSRAVCILLKVAYWVLAMHPQSQSWLWFVRSMMKLQGSAVANGGVLC